MAYDGITWLGLLVFSEQIFGKIRHFEPVEVCVLVRMYSDTESVWLFKGILLALQCLLPCVLMAAWRWSTGLFGVWGWDSESDWLCRDSELETGTGFDNSLHPNVNFSGPGYHLTWSHVVKSFVFLLGSSLVSFPWFYFLGAVCLVFL